MIELAIKGALERITGMNAYPLLLPDTVQEGVTYQRISDAPVGAGLARTGLSSVRIQVAIYLIDNYSRLLMLDKQLWSEWKA
ncbi:hypothetical protein Q6333_28985, partial [Klebsiella pneumoniae]|nr:hypothetical protein [Klebsiella pneumoniae]